MIHAVKRPPRGFVVGLLLILMAAASLLLFLVGSSYGAAVVLRVAMALGGEGYAAGVSGSLYYGLQVERLEFRGFDLSIEADDLRFEVNWPALLDRRLDIVEASVHRLILDLPPAAEPDPNEPFRIPDMPQWPDLPIGVSVQRLAVNELRLGREGIAMPIEVDQAALHANLNADGLVLGLEGIEVRAPDASLHAHGQILLGPATAAADDTAAAAAADEEAPAIHAADAAAPAENAPTVDAKLVLSIQQGDEFARVNLAARGTLADLQVEADGSGYSLNLQATAKVAPFSETLPVSALTLKVEGFEPSAWMSAAPAARLNVALDAQFEGALWPEGQFGIPQPETLRTQLQLDVLEGSTWRGEPFVGQVRLHQDGWRLPEVVTDLRLASNHVSLNGAAGATDDVIDWRVQLPQPAAIWPGLVGGADLSGRWRGMPTDHEFSLEGTVTLPPGMLPENMGGAGVSARELMPFDTEADSAGGVVVDGNQLGDATEIAPAIDVLTILGQGPHRVALTLQGGWQPGHAAGAASAADGGAAGSVAAGWQGRISRLSLTNPQTSIQLGEPLALAVRLPSPVAPLHWEAGATTITWNLPDDRRITLQHEGSQGTGSEWQTAGRIQNLVPAWVVAALPRNADPLTVDLAWDLEQAGNLRGTFQLRRRSGDIVLPAETPIALGLEALQLDLRATPRAANSSDLNFQLDVRGRVLGSVSANGSTVLQVQNGVPIITEAQPVALNAQLAINDLGWTVAFTGDEIELGGQLRGDVSLQRTGGNWDASGALEAEGLRVVRIDDGIRLLDGSLRARFTQDRIDVESLRFPSVIRSTPRNAAVQAWVEQFGDAGYVQASGGWSLSEAQGRATVEISQYPLVQRADRFIAGSGQVQIEASPRRMSITGKVTADIGWISLEGSDELPSLSSDVVIVQANDPPDDFRDQAVGSENNEPLALRLNLEVDLGNRMMLTGMGLNTELVGAINVRNSRGGLRATGVVNTREGRFSIYGQTLEVRRGTVTFDGLLDDPLLDIVAVRPHLQVQAGVQVSGTARAPEISLISFPDVPETEKLSWLLLGRGPDAHGADTGLLLSAAASMLGGDQPLSSELGLDELGLRSGTGGSISGILPHTTVVGDFNELSRGDEAGQFLVAGKRLSDSLYVTFEQALNGREAVVRASYRISERLSASIQGGTINGLQLVWSLIW